MKPHKHGRDERQIATATGTPFLVVLTPADGAWAAELMDGDQKVTPVAGTWPSVSRALLEGLRAAGSRDARTEVPS